MDDTARRIKSLLLAKHLQGVAEVDLGYGTPLIGFGVGVDSVSTLELIVSLEGEFGISIDESSLTPESLVTIEAIAALVAGQVPGG